MTQKSFENFINEIYSRGPKQSQPTNKTDVYHTDDIWCLDISDLKHYGPEAIRGYRYFFVIIDSFSKYGWSLTLKNRNAQLIKNSFEKILITSKRKPNLMETLRGKKLFIIIFFKIY